MCKKILELGEWRGKPAGRCSCGFIRTSGISIQREENIADNKVGNGFVESGQVIGFNFSCGKCGFDRADVRELGEILGNEKSVTLFTCLKCGSVERR